MRVAVNDAMALPLLLRNFEVNLNCFAVDCFENAGRLHVRQICSKLTNILGPLSRAHLSLGFVCLACFVSLDCSLDVLRSVLCCFVLQRVNQNARHEVNDSNVATDAKFRLNELQVSTAERKRQIVRNISRLEVLHLSAGYLRVIIPRHCGPPLHDLWQILLDGNIAQHVETHRRPELFLRVLARVDHAVDRGREHSPKVSRMLVETLQAPHHATNVHRVLPRGSQTLRCALHARLRANRRERQTLVEYLPVQRVVNARRYFAFGLRVRDELNATR